MIVIIPMRPTWKWCAVIKQQFCMAWLVRTTPSCLFERMKQVWKIFLGNWWNCYIVRRGNRSQRKINFTKTLERIGSETTLQTLVHSQIDLSSLFLQEVGLYRHLINPLRIWISLRGIQLPSRRLGLNRAQSVWKLWYYSCFFWRPLLF